METILAYLKSGNLSEKANVIEQIYYNKSDKVADKLDKVLKKTKN